MGTCLSSCPNDAYLIVAILLSNPLSLSVVGINQLHILTRAEVMGIPSKIRKQNKIPWAFMLCWKLISFSAPLFLSPCPPHPRNNLSCYEEPSGYVLMPRSWFSIQHPVRAWALRTGIGLNLDMLTRASINMWIGVETNCLPVEPGDKLSLSQHLDCSFLRDLEPEEFS